VRDVGLEQALRAQLTAVSAGACQAVRVALRAIQECPTQMHRYYLWPIAISAISQSAGTSQPLLPEALIAAAGKVE
jgi:hypothetical protein